MWQRSTKMPHAKRNRRYVKFVQKFSTVNINHFAPNSAQNFISLIISFIILAAKSGLSQHLQTHVDIKETRTQCHVCGTWLKNEYLLKTHVRRIHNAKPLKCPHCDKIKPNRNSLSRHISESHSAPSHHCTYCDKAFVRAISLKVSFLETKMKKHS